MYMMMIIQQQVKNRHPEYINAHEIGNLQDDGLETNCKETYSTWRIHLFRSYNQTMLQKQISNTYLTNGHIVKILHASSKMYMASSSRQLLASLSNKLSSI